MLAEIPLIDVRDGGPLRHARLRREAALLIRQACFAGVPRFLGGGLALADRGAAWWLSRSASCYAAELEAIAELIAGTGIHTMNMSYQWGCTTAALPQAEATMLLRTLDWPFAGLGRGVEVAWQKGPAGEFFNVTWPGAVGVITGMAPGRFAAVINQAPLRRRVWLPGCRAIDYGVNLVQTVARERGWPPDHLLRRAFETCGRFDEAVELLCREPVARPVIYTIAGVDPEAIVVIERTESSARCLPGRAIVVNDWQEARPGWEPRGCDMRDLVGDNQRRRSEIAEGLENLHAKDCFAWVRPPVLNAETRVAVEANASAGELRVQGYEPDGEIVSPATAIFDLARQPALHAA
ncbi:MAG: hypothetical protein JO366_18945 [Methylobacteriaceae bacterium]|nr:hypothetical protein [Methylobacteriaceae bacterium]MBV9246881.1 hypothetical protein [Methylobacteriaceae bacterium]